MAADGLAKVGRCLAVLGGAMVLAGCEVRLGAPVSLFDDEPALAKALDVVQADARGPVRLFKVTIEPDQAVFQMQDPREPGRVGEWRLVRSRMAVLSWDRMAGPRRVDPVLVNPRHDQNLFDLKEVDIAAFGRVADAAIAHARLEDRAGVARIEIARPPVLLPERASGPVRWTIEVRSTRENASIYADASGRIVGADLNGTIRMKNLDMYQRPELAADAAAAVGAHVSGDAVLTKVSFSASSIAFETNIPDDSFPFNSPGGLRGAAVYSWSLHGLRRAMIGRVDTARYFSNPDQPFRVADLDWTLLPKIVVEARTRLDMPDGRVTDIMLSKPSSGVGLLALEWRVDITQNRERGRAVFDASGSLRRLQQPASRRKPVDWLEPEAAADALSRIAAEFGPAGRIVEILIHDRQVSITAEDPREPGRSMQALLNDEGFSRFGTASRTGVAGAFTMKDIEAVSVKHLTELAGRTLAELGMPPGSVERITIGRGTIQSTRDNSVKIEIRADAAGVGSGWGVYELDGRVVRYMKP